MPNWFGCVYDYCPEQPILLDLAAIQVVGLILSLTIWTYSSFFILAPILCQAGRETQDDASTIMLVFYSTLNPSECTSFTAQLVQCFYFILF